MLLEKKNKATVSTMDENELLERISKLEIEKKQNQNVIEMYLKNNDLLESKIQKMGETQREYLTLNEKLQNEETLNKESLKFELERATAEVRELRLENSNLEKQNQKLLEDFQKIELKREHDERAMDEERSQNAEKLEQSEAMNREYGVKIAQIQAKLADKTCEIEKMNSKRNEYHRKYNMIQQLNKTNETTIRSLQKDLAEAHEEAREASDKLQRIRGNIEDLLRRWKLAGDRKEQVQEVVELFGDAVSIHGGLDDQVSMISEAGSNFELSKNLKLLDEDFAGANFNVSGKSSFLKSLSNLDSVTMKNAFQMRSFNENFKLLHDNPSTFLKRGNGETTLANDEAQVASIDEQVEKDEERRKREERRKFIKEEFQTELQQILDKRISSKMHINPKKPKKDILDNLAMKAVDMGAGDRAKEEFHARRLAEFEESLRGVVFAEFDSFSKSILNELEKDHLKRRFESMPSVQKSVAWLVHYFREKISELGSRLKSSEAENSRAGVTTEITRHSLEKKQKELEDLLQTFRKRNEEYEKLLNESLLVNTRLFKQRKNKIKHVKKIEKKKFRKKIERMLETKHKSPASSFQQEKKASGFMDLIRDSFKFEDKGPKGGQRRQGRRTQTMREISRQGSRGRQNTNDDLASTLSDKNLKTIIKDLQDPRARKRRFLMQTGSSSEDDHEGKIFGNPRDEFVETRQNEQETPREGRLRSLKPSMDFDYESHIICKKTIDDPQTKLKEDLLVTTLDYPRQPTFGPETPWGASERNSMNFSGRGSNLVD